MLAILEKIKNKFKKDVPLNYGYVDLSSGKSFIAHKTPNGQVVHKPSGKVNPWSEAIYVTTITIKSTLISSGFFGESKSYPLTENKALYKKTNNLTGKSIYFYYKDGKSRFIDSNAWEIHQTIVFI